MASGDFDPYHVWLGIPPKDQPPNHYRLLGIELFESDAQVIESGADRQMAHVRTFQMGRHSTQSQRVLNEIAAAKIALLTPANKSAYDAILRARLAFAASSIAVPPAAPSAPSDPPPLPLSADRAPTKSGARRAAIILCLFLALTALIGLVCYVRWMGSRPQLDPDAHKSSRPNHDTTRPSEARLFAPGGCGGRWFRARG